MRARACSSNEKERIFLSDTAVAELVVEELSVYHYVKLLGTCMVQTFTTKRAHFTPMHVVYVLHLGMHDSSRKLGLTGEQEDNLVQNALVQSTIS